MSVRAYYAADFGEFLAESDEKILGQLARCNEFSLEHEQRDAWLSEIAILREALAGEKQGRLFLEFQIPRMGKRADAVLLLRNAVAVVEFKVGAREYDAGSFAQVEDYALDLKNFHYGSRGVAIIPILVATAAFSRAGGELAFAPDLVAQPLGGNGSDLAAVVASITQATELPIIDKTEWTESGYRPTPTIIEAAEVLYRNHSVEEISRSDAGAINLRQTSEYVAGVIEAARRDAKKAICFITGVPGAGKTLAGMNIAMRRLEDRQDEHAVFLSGNGPLVDVLREALIRDQVQRSKESRSDARRKVRTFIQNIHVFRDQYLRTEEVPFEKVVVFDEAQRAWNQEQASKFVMQKRGVSDFNMSEPEFLIEVMDRHIDWCVIVCLVGGGQEINTGEAGLPEWARALAGRFPEWRIYVSTQISSPEYGGPQDLGGLLQSDRVFLSDHLHLAVSMRSFRSERLSEFVGHLVENSLEEARQTYGMIRHAYPICVTRDLAKGREWLRNRARGTERFGLVASSGALRLRPEGIHIKATIDPANWFLNASSDVRSSFYLEEVATEFAVQGLELDWVCVCWDGNFFHDQKRWRCQSFRGTRWQGMRDESRQRYLKNAYRVLLTRARQGMVLFVPRGDEADVTRQPALYDGTYQFLRSCGIPSID